MRLNLSRRWMFAALTAAGTLCTAHAANLVEIDGANVQFFYDADFWGAGSSTVTADTISFALSKDYDVTAQSQDPNGADAANFIGSSKGGLFAVAHTGYNLSTFVGISTVGTYTMSATGGTVANSLFSLVSGGSGYKDGNVSGVTVTGAFSAGRSHGAAGVPGGGGISPMAALFSVR